MPHPSLHGAIFKFYLFPFEFFQTRIFFFRNIGAVSTSTPSRTAATPSSTVSKLSGLSFHHWATLRQGKCSPYSNRYHFGFKLFSLLVSVIKIIKQKGLVILPIYERSKYFRVMHAATFCILLISGKGTSICNSDS